jgi:hypothetical protein
MVMATRMGDAKQLGNRARGQLGGDRLGAQARGDGRTRDAKQQAIAVLDKDILGARVPAGQPRSDPESPPIEGMARVVNDDFFPGVGE